MKLIRFGEAGKEKPGVIINENWFDLTGNNIFKSVFKVVKTIRGGIEKVSDTYKNIKD